MARPHDLVAGNCYFTLLYYDNELLIPSVQTLIYQGVDVCDDGQRVWLFEEPSSTGSAEPVVTIGFPDEQLARVLDLAGLLKGLAGISDFHPLKPPPASPGEVGMEEEEGRELRAQILAFASDPECSSVTATILFTDDALSFGKRKEGGFEMRFFPHPKTGNSDRAIFDFFKARGVDPHVDYLSDNGRTRVLAFAIPDDTDSLEHLCARIFVDIFRIRRDDTLKFFQRRSRETDRIP